MSNFPQDPWSQIAPPGTPEQEAQAISPAPTAQAAPAPPRNPPVIQAFWDQVSTFEDSWGMPRGTLQAELGPHLDKASQWTREAMQFVEEAQKWGFTTPEALGRLLARRGATGEELIE